MRKLYASLIFLCIGICLQQSVSSQVVISQVYGGGGNVGATYKNDFIEIFNNSNASVNLSGWSVQYASATGTSWATTALSGTIAPGQHYLIQEAAGTGGTVDLPAPDATGGINMSGTAGKVALVNSTVALVGACTPNASIIDLVGFGLTANCFEGAGPTPAPSNTNAVLRANNGCIDTDNNAGNFSAGLPNPRNIASPLNSCLACNAPTNQPTALVFTASLSSIDGSFTPAATGTTPADNYLVLITSAASLSQQPVSGTAYTVGAALGNAVVLSNTSATSFSASGLNSATTYNFFVYSFASTGTCYNLTSPLNASVSTNANPAPTVSVAAGINAAEPSTNGSFVVNLSAPAPAGGVSILYSFSGTATPNFDFVDPLSSVLLIPEGGSSGTINITVVDDPDVESPETITVALNTVNAGYIISIPSASISLTDNEVSPGILLSSTYTQDFNSLALTGTAIPWSDNSTINGWYASRVVYNAGNGSSNTGALYSLGSTGSSDRALGSVGSSSTGIIYYGARFKNNTGTTISSVRIVYTGEQWRNGGVAATQTVNFGYQTGVSLTSLTAGTWTAVTALNFTSPVTGTTAAALDGNQPGTTATIQIATINGLNIAPNEELMIRWEDIDHSGADHALAIDDFSIEANPADLVPPVVTTLFPANGGTDQSTNVAATITFDETVVKGTGNIIIHRNDDNSIFQTIDVNSAAVNLNGTTATFNLAGLSQNTGYYIEIDNAAFEDLSGNDFIGISGNATWAFTTGTNFFAANFNSCTSSLTDGFTQFSSVGSVVWSCTAFGRDPAAPAGTAAFPNAVQINGFSGGTNTPNVDWLISQSFNLTGTTYPLLSFWSRTAFNGLPLQLKVSTDYTSGDPALATWTDINGKFPQQTSNIWTLSADINLSAFKQSNVHFAFVYTSSDDDGARWTVDDISVANSATPPAPSLTIGTTDIQFNYVAAGAAADKTFTFVGNDLTNDVSLTSTGNFLLSKDGSNFSTTISYTVAEANNITKTVYTRFAPTQNNQNFTGTINVTTGSNTADISLKGTSIDPVTTLEVVNWNVEWFGSPTMEPNNDDQQEANIQTVLKSVGADIYGLIEVVDEARLARIVSQMPGYSYVIANYGSHTNPSAPSPGPLSAAQKAAFVYKTSMFSNISTTALLSVGIHTPADINNPNYNAWASGRFPFMMSADVTLNCVTKNVKFILVHAKANTSPTNISYERRKSGADALYDLLAASYSNDNVIILGDFNDDLDQSITAGFTITSWDKFTNDVVNYSPLTLPLSLAGKKSTVSYNDVIDHVVVSNDLSPFYLPATAAILSDVTSLVSNYGGTTTDHFPVFTRYRFPNTTAPVISTCPVVTPLCVNASGNYAIPLLQATDDCDTVRYSYVITGATQRTGSTKDASGQFNIGNSTITWTVTDEWGNSSTCTTTVQVNAVPTVSIPDAFALPSGTSVNTVYLGYTPASSLQLAPVTTGGTPAYNFSWNSGASTSTLTVSPTITTTYQVTVTDISGCQAQASATVFVKDIRAGNNQNKVFICHKPAGQSNTLEVNQSQVASHLQHGDQLGSCTNSNVTPLSITAAPNPSFNHFTITARGGKPATGINMRVINILGKTVEQRQNLQANQQVQIGGNYQTGIYFVEISQGTDRAFIALLKIRI